MTVVDFRVQVAPRGIGVFQGLQCTFHPMMAQPSYIEIKDKPLDERVAIMRDPSFREKCLSEKPIKLAGEGSSVPPIADTMIAAIDLVANKFFRLGAEPDYEQGPDQSLGAEARRRRHVRHGETLRHADRDSTANSSSISRSIITPNSTTTMSTRC